MARIQITDKNVAPGSTKYVDPGMRLTGQNQEHAHWLSVLGLGLRMYLWVCFWPWWRRVWTQRWFADSRHWREPFVECRCGSLSSWQSHTRPSYQTYTCSQLH